MRTYLFFAVAAVVAVVGCSGGGADFSATVEPARSFLDDQATVATLCQHWLPVLFPAQLRDVDQDCEPTQPEYTANPDGSMTVRYRRSDCAEAEWWVSADWSEMRGVTTYPDGSKDRELTRMQLMPDGSTRAEVHRELASGATWDMAFTMPVPGEKEKPVHTIEGVLRLPSGQRIEISAERWNTSYRLTLRSPEGWQFDLDAPTAMFQDVQDLAQQAVGALRANGRRRLSFTLRALDGAAYWNRMSIEAPDGLTGEIDLSAAQTGQGSILQRGKLLMTITWNTSGRVRATYADGHTAVGHPSAAARDFMVDRWMWSLAEFGPSPR